MASLNHWPLLASNHPQFSENAAPGQLCLFFGINGLIFDFFIICDTLQRLFFISVYILIFQTIDLMYSFWFILISFSFCSNCSHRKHYIFPTSSMLNSDFISCINVSNRSLLLVAMIKSSTHRMRRITLFAACFLYTQWSRWFRYSFRTLYQFPHHCLHNKGIS